MGYCIYLIDRENSITEKMLDKVVEKLPARLMGVIGSKQETFWSLATDVSLRKNSRGVQYVKVSGSFSASGKWALDMTLYLQQLLQKEGLEIEVCSDDFGYENKELEAWMEN